jgi:hypothetical protein
VEVEEKGREASSDRSLRFVSRRVVSAVTRVKGGLRSRSYDHRAPALVSAARFTKSRSPPWSAHVDGVTRQPWVPVLRHRGPPRVRCGLCPGAGLPSGTVVRVLLARHCLHLVGRGYDLRFLITCPGPGRSARREPAVHGRGRAAPESGRGAAGRVGPGPGAVCGAAGLSSREIRSVVRNQGHPGSSLGWCHGGAQERAWWFNLVSAWSS